MTKHLLRGLPPLGAGWCTAEQWTLRAFLTPGMDVLAELLGTPKSAREPELPGLKEAD